MAFALIRPASYGPLEVARSDDALPVDADRAAQLLRADLERWSRWAMGVLGFVAAIVGVFIGLGTMETVRRAGVAPDAVDVVVVAGSLTIGIGGCVLLLRLWWTGRRLASAAAWWLRLPYTAGGRQRLGGGWLRARTVNLEPRVLVRIVSSTTALLVAVFGLSAPFYELYVDQATPSLAVPGGCVGLIALLAGLGQAGGVLRVVSGLSEGDPLWVRIRTAMRGR